MSENATEANAQVAERMFIERTLWPKLARISQKITQDLLPFWPGSYVAEFEDIRPTDVQARMDEIRTSYPVLSINEIRSRYYQLPAVVWGESPVGTQSATATAATAANNLALPETSTAVGTGRALSETNAAKFQLLTAANAELRLPSGDVSNDDQMQMQHLQQLQHNAADPTQNFLSELTRWERFSLKRWGKSNGRSFEVRNLPEEIAFLVSAGLLASTSPDEARAVFAAARSEMRGELQPESEA